MSWRTALQRAHDFAVSNPQRLREQLEAFERTFLDAFRELRTALGEPRPIRRIISGGAIVQHGELVLCDTTSASFEILLPDPTQLPQRLRVMPFCVIIKTVAANAITVRPLGSAQINNAATVSLSSVAAYDVFEDGANYWREF